MPDGPIGSGYKTLADHLIKFHELGQMPVELGINSLDEGNGIEAPLIAHHAKWHKSCRLKLNQTKLDRLQNKQPTRKASTSSGVQTLEKQC